VMKEGEDEEWPVERALAQSNTEQRVRTARAGGATRLAATRSAAARQWLQPAGGHYRARVARPGGPAKRTPLIRPNAPRARGVAGGAAYVGHTSPPLLTPSTHNVWQGSKGPLRQGRQGRQGRHGWRQEEAHQPLSEGRSAVPRGPHPPLPEGEQRVAALERAAAPWPLGNAGTHAAPPCPSRALPPVAASAPRPPSTAPPSSVRARRFWPSPQLFSPT